MRSERSVQIICADPLLTRRYLKELQNSCQLQQTPLAQWGDPARWDRAENDGQSEPSVILLDESAVDVGGGASLEATLATLAETAPIVVVAAPERQSELAFFITSGCVDFVARTGHFVPVAAGLVERRLRLADSAARLSSEEALAEDFGEVLRHEVNNPLTGILGNAELLLARQEGLPPNAVDRVKTIAELAVRLRETVRRLSNAWMLRHDHVDLR